MATSLAVDKDRRCIRNGVFYLLFCKTPNLYLVQKKQIQTHLVIFLQIYNFIPIRQFFKQ